MKEISLAFPVPYYNANKYLPLIKELGDKISVCYGIGDPRGFRHDESYPLNKFYGTKIPGRAAMLVTWLQRVFRYPQYYGYWTRIQLCDIIFSLRIKKDPCKLLYTSPLFLRTIKAAKKLSKIVVIEAGNSEPAREYQKIMQEYNKFNIKRRYVYGNTKFRDTCLEALNLSDKIITISKVSAKTYKNAGFDMNKFKLIPLTGTDMPLKAYNDVLGKAPAFITTGFHNFIKGTQELLLAWKKAAIKDIPLLVVGKLCEDMQEFIAIYGPFINVQFVGHRSDLKEWYSTWDGVGVLLSLSEGAGRVTPEMMSFGFPMITSQDATCDLVEDGKNGFVIDTFDTDAIVERLRWFAEDWTRVRSMRSDVLSTVKKRSMMDYSLECGEFLNSLI